MNFQKMTAENIYLNLMTMPKKDWGKVITTLTDERRNDLLHLLRQKKSGGQLASKSIKDSLCNEKVSSASISLPVSTEPCELRCKSPVHNEVMLETPVLVQSTSDIVPKSQDNECKKVSSILFPLENIQDLMFVSGDSCNILHESEIILQRYINVWFRLVLKSWCQVICEENQKKNEIKMFEQINWHDAMFYFEKKFSYQFSLYKEKVNLQNSARHTLWKSNAYVNDLLVENEMEDTIQISDQTATGEESTHSRKEVVISTKHSTFIDHIEPHDRFSKRLKTQDLRTQRMNTVEYQRFSKARESVSRTFRTSFSKWLKKSIKNYMELYGFDCSNNPPQFSTCNSQFLSFLITDRIASLVELACRLRFFNTTQTFQFNDAPFTLCEEWFTSCFSRFEKLYDSGIYMNDVSSILSRNQGTLDKNPVDPIYYQYAIALYLNSVDSYQLNIPSQTCIECFLKSFDLCLSNQIKKRKRKYTNPETTSYQIDNGKKQNKKLVNANEPSKTLAYGLYDSYNDLTTDMHQFFDRLICQVSETQSSTLKIPEKIVVFAFLKCRDIFWRYRYETITTIWSAVYERFSKEARCMSKSFEQFLQAYNKIIDTMQKINEILLFESYFKNFFNVNKNDTLEIFLSNQKNEKSCIQMNTLCDTLEENCV